MDVIRFLNPTHPLKMEQAFIVNGLSSKMWIERYLEAGEFTFVSPATAEMQNRLPIGSFVSHVDTREIAIVESQEIVEDEDEEAELVIRGRSLETINEQRIVGGNKVFPTTGAPLDYTMSVNSAAAQAVQMIYEHTDVDALLDPNDAFPYIHSSSLDPSPVGDPIGRTFSRRTLYETLLELLSFENLGIKVTRPGPDGPLWVGEPTTMLHIHRGVDKTDSIVFSSDTGEIERAEYIWSNKNFKNSAIVSGRWVETIVVTAANGYDRRIMHIDASDIDGQFEEAPTGFAYTDVIDALVRRGQSTLATQRNVALTRAEVSKNASRAAYRTDFDVGDLITVNGSFNESSVMRITEYVEIEDETGSSGYPTLELA